VNDRLFQYPAKVEPLYDGQSDFDPQHFPYPPIDSPYLQKWEAVNYSLRGGSGAADGSSLASQGEV
jgi:hypothetical protein